MISPVSSQGNVHLQQTQPTKTQSAPQQAQQSSSHTEDSVQISPEAKAALASQQDKDHDGDSH